MKNNILKLLLLSVSSTALLTSCGNAKETVQQSKPIPSEISEKTRLEIGTHFDVSKIPTSRKQNHIGDSQNEKTDFGNGYWSNQILESTKVTTFLFDANKTHSVSDIVSMMNDQVHFNFDVSLEKMTPIQFANYIVDLYRNTGGGVWKFICVYKGMQDTIYLNGRNILERFIRSLDGDSENPPLSLTSQKATQGMVEMINKPGLNIEELVKMTADHYDLFGDLNLDEVMNLLAALPAASINLFPEFVNLFISLGEKFSLSKASTTWANDQSPEETKKFQHINTEIIKEVLISGN